MKNENVKIDPYGEFWVEKTTGPHKIQWLAGTGSPRSFVNQELANNFQKEIPDIKITKYTENPIHRSFTNNNIEIKGVLSINLKSGSWTAKACNVLTVENKTNNIIGRGNLTKLGITLSAHKKNPGDN